MNPHGILHAVKDGQNPRFQPEPSAGIDPQFQSRRSEQNREKINPSHRYLIKALKRLDTINPHHHDPKNPSNQASRPLLPQDPIYPNFS
ncbi:hypothetical protein DSO57_1033116 [Entomophthora muscae]|uniref:Uncharacterized protein n=1 Tax=Entomophthora muscae TaxID=34485 RepID=A0ACC2SPA1_9FUNG|nr:hypothetical protein DSO57_1033116 [Entomophthora muscae]